MLSRRFRLSLCAVSLICAGARAEDPKDASAELTLAREQLKEQSTRIAELQNQLSNLSLSVSGFDGVKGEPARSRRGEPRFRQLFTVRRDGTDLQELVAAPGMLVTSTPNWSHDGKMLVCDSVPETDALAESRIWIYAAGGPFKGMMRYLTAGNTPCWSPDDSRIAFMVNGGNPDGVEGGAWVINVDGTDRLRLGEGWFTRWSPSGRHVCVYAYFTQPPSLKIYNLETGDDRFVLGKEEGEDEEITVLFGGGNWTPDGEKFVTLVQRGNEHQLITIDTTGFRDSIRVLHRQPVGDRSLVGPPVMSPDGREVVFGVQEMNHEDTNSRTWMNTWLYIIAADGKSEPRLLEGQKFGKINRGADWSRDGKRIVFSSER